MTSPICISAEIVPKMSRKCPVTEEAIVNDLVMGSVDKAGIDLLQSSVINARPDPVSTTVCSSVADIVSCTNGVGGVHSESCLLVTLEEGVAAMRPAMAALNSFPDHVCRKVNTPCRRPMVELTMVISVCR